MTYKCNLREVASSVQDPEQEKEETVSINVLYDGRCGFCIQCVKFLRRLDTFGTFKFYDFHDQATLKEFPMINRQDAEEAMLAITETGGVFQGFFAFRRLIWVSPWLWPVVPFFYFPGVRFLGTRVYAWVARNRRKLGCRIEAREG